MGTDSLISSNDNHHNAPRQTTTVSSDEQITSEHDALIQPRPTAENRRSRGYFRHRHSAPLEFIPDKYSYMFRPKTWWELTLISGTVCGVEFCYSAETAFVTPLLLSLGLDMKYVTMIWCLSPFIGLILTPILGSMSDSCESRLGRRRPFILVHSIGILLGLFLVPNGQLIGQALGDSGNVTSIDTDVPTTETPIQTWSIVFVAMGTIFLDFCADSCQSPTRTYVLDVSIPDDHAIGLSTFGLMAGLGGSLGYVMGAIDWENTFYGQLMDSQIRTVFSLVAMVYVVCLLSSVCNFPEIPLPLLRDPKVSKEYQKRMGESSVSGKEVDEKRNKVKNYGSTDHIEEGEDSGKRDSLERRESTNNENESHSISLPKELLNSREHLTLSKYLKSIVLMPTSIKILCLTALFCWMSLLCYTLYFTDFVGESVYGGDPSAPKDSLEFQLYKEGVRFGCWGMALSSLFCAGYSLILEKLVKKVGCRKTYIGGQLVYFFGMITMAVTRHKLSVILLSPTTGMMYATLFTMPYILMANYHSKNQFSDNLEESNAARGIGTDVATLSSMVFLAQIILSLSMGAIVDAVGSNVAIVWAAVLLSGCGALCATRVVYLDI